MTIGMCILIGVLAFVILWVIFSIYHYKCVGWFYDLADSIGAGFIMTMFLIFVAISIIFIVGLILYYWNTHI